jgi:deoxyadenosine/deoxycytidine kinase
MEDVTMLQLFLADRVEHQKCVRKILGVNEHTIVLSDRGDLSTYVFQYLLPQDYLPNQDLLKKMVKTFSDNAPITVPKTYFIVMACVDTLRKRIAARGIPQDRWESNTVLDRVNYFYQYLKYYADSTKAFAGHALWDLMYLDSDANDVLQLATFAAAHIATHSGVTPAETGSKVTLVEELDRLQRKQLAQVLKSQGSDV